MIITWILITFWMWYWYTVYDGPSLFNDPKSTSSSSSSAMIKTEEAVILSLIFSIWFGIILLFFKQWGKIRLLEPYHPRYDPATDHLIVTNPHSSLVRASSIKLGRSSSRASATQRPIRSITAHKQWKKANTMVQMINTNTPGHKLSSLTPTTANVIRNHNFLMESTNVASNSNIHHRSLDMMLKGVVVVDRHATLPFNQSITRKSPSAFSSSRVERSSSQLMIGMIEKDAIEADEREARENEDELNRRRQTGSNTIDHSHHNQNSIYSSQPEVNQNSDNHNLGDGRFLNSIITQGSLYSAVRKIRSNDNDVNRMCSSDGSDCFFWPIVPKDQQSSYHTRDDHYSRQQKAMMNNGSLSHQHQYQSGSHHHPDYHHHVGSGYKNKGDIIMNIEKSSSIPKDNKDDRSVVESIITKTNGHYHQNDNHHFKPINNHVLHHSSSSEDNNSVVCCESNHENSSNHQSRKSKSVEDINLCKNNILLSSVIDMKNI